MWAPTSNQTRWANKQTSSKQDGQTSRKEKEKKKKENDKEKDKENEKEKEKQMEVWFISSAAVCPEGAGGLFISCFMRCLIAFLC